MSSASSFSMFTLSLNVISNDASFSAGGWLCGQGHIDKPLISAVASVNVRSIFTRRVSGSLSWGKFTFNFPSSTHDCDDFAICCAAPKTHSCVSTLAGGGVYIFDFNIMRVGKRAIENCQWVSIRSWHAFNFLKTFWWDWKCLHATILYTTVYCNTLWPSLFFHALTHTDNYSWKRKTNLISAKNRHYKCDPLKWLMRGWVAIKD